MSIIKIANEEEKKKSNILTTFPAATTAIGATGGAGYGLVDKARKRNYGKPVKLGKASGLGALGGAAVGAITTPTIAANMNWNKHNKRDIRQFGPGSEGLSKEEREKTTVGERFLKSEKDNHGGLRSREEFVKDDALHGGKAPVGKNALLGGITGLGIGALEDASNALDLKSGRGGGLPRGLHALGGAAVGATLLGHNTRLKEQAHRNAAYNAARGTEMKNNEEE